MSAPLDVLAALRKLLDTGDFTPSPEVHRLLDELDARLTPEERQRLEGSLREGLPALRALKGSPALSEAVASPDAPPPLAPDEARRLLDGLAAAWARRDGQEVDALLASLDARAPSGLQAAREAERQRIGEEVRGAISARFSGVSFPPLGAAGKKRDVG